MKHDLGSFTGDPNTPHRIVKSHHVQHRVHGRGLLGTINTKVAVVITTFVGSMYCAYLFVIIALVSFPAAYDAFSHGDTLVGISWLSQSFIQLVLLPVIMVGQRVLSAAQDARAETDHETLTILHEINMQQLAILELLASVRKTNG